MEFVWKWCSMWFVSLMIMVLFIIWKLSIRFGIFWLFGNWRWLKVVFVRNILMVLNSLVCFMSGFFSLMRLIGFFRLLLVGVWYGFWCWFCFRFFLNCWLVSNFLLLFLFVFWKNWIICRSWIFFMRFLVIVYCWLIFGLLSLFIFMVSLVLRWVRRNVCFLFVCIGWLLSLVWLRLIRVSVFMVVVFFFCWRRLFIVFLMSCCIRFLICWRWCVCFIVLIFCNCFILFCLILSVCFNWFRKILWCWFMRLCVWVCMCCCFCLSRWFDEKCCCCGWFCGGFVLWWMGMVCLLFLYVIIKDFYYDCIYLSLLWSLLCWCFVC